MPKIKKSGIKTPANQQKGKKVCTCCHKEKKMTDYYLSYSPMYDLDKRVPICKECCKKSCLNDDGTIDYEAFKNLLRQIDKPLYYDLLDSATNSIKSENSYLSDEETELHGCDILSKYFTLVVLRQDRATSYVDSEKENFMHQNNNRTNEEKTRIILKYSPLFMDEKQQSILNKNNIQEDIVENKKIEFSEKDKKNMEYVISTIGYNPFEDIGLSEIDKKYCFNILSGYCDTDGISEDGHKIQSVIEMTMLYYQCKKIDEEVNRELSKRNINDEKIQKLTRSKSSLLSSINNIAKDNNISSNYNKNSKQGQSSLSSKMKEMAENGYSAIEVNLFDIKTAEAFKQIDEISNTNISNQLTLDNNEYTEIVKEQREMIENFEKQVDSLEEENRNLKNRIIQLENMEE